MNLEQLKARLVDGGMLGGGDSCAHDSDSVVALPKAWQIFVRKLTQMCVDRCSKESDEQFDETVREQIAECIVEMDCMHLEDHRLNRHAYELNEIARVSGINAEIVCYESKQLSTPDSCIFSDALIDHIGFHDATRRFAFQVIDYCADICHDAADHFSSLADAHLVLKRLGETIQKLKTTDLCTHQEASIDLRRSQHPGC